MDADEKMHQANGLIFVAIASASPEFALPLANVLASTDFYEQSIPRPRELEHALRDLGAAGLIGGSGDPYSLTDEGQRLWTKIRSEVLTPRHVEQADIELRFIACVNGAPGISIDQSDWERALAAYSPDFALKLSRRRGPG